MGSHYCHLKLEERRKLAKWLEPQQPKDLNSPVSHSVDGHINGTRMFCLRRPDHNGAAHFKLSDYAME